jgi:hypothetical protein
MEIAPSEAPVLRLENARAMRKAAASATTNTATKRIHLRQPRPSREDRDDAGPDDVGVSGSGRTSIEGRYVTCSPLRSGTTTGASTVPAFVRDSCSVWTSLLGADQVGANRPESD